MSDDATRDAFVAGMVFAAGPARAHAALVQLDELELTPAELYAEHTGRRELLPDCGGSVAGVISVGKHEAKDGSTYYLAACPACVDAEPAFGSAGRTADEAVARLREHLAVEHPGEPAHDVTEGEPDAQLVARLDAALAEAAT